MSCIHCGKDAIYKCIACEKLVCREHTRLRTVCTACVKKATLTYSIEKVSADNERRKIREFVERFWGEQEQLTFSRRFKVAELPSYTAKVKDQIVGFTSFAEVDETIIIVALGVLPEYQGFSVGKALVEKVEGEAKRLQKKKLLVSTSNDDLPALAFYQRLGFQIYEVKPNVIAEKHGEDLKGIGGLPVRDELRLRKIIH